MIHSSPLITKYMKKEIHPEYYEDAKITCACGETYEVGSTKEKISVELCANCHPFYTGKQKIVDSGRRVERFEKLRKRHEEIAEEKGGEPEAEQIDENAEEKTEEETSEDSSGRKSNEEILKKMKDTINTSDE